MKEERFNLENKTFASLKVSSIPFPPNTPPCNVAKTSTNLAFISFCVIYMCFFIYLRPLDFLNIMSLTSELKWEEIGKLYWERILSQIWQPNEYKNQTFLSSSDVLVEDIPLSRFWICDCRPDMISISLWFSCRRLFLNSSTSITCQALFLISLSEQMQSYAVEWSWP